MTPCTYSHVNCRDDVIKEHHLRLSEHIVANTAGSELTSVLVAGHGPVHLGHRYCPVISIMRLIGQVGMVSDL